MYPLRANTVKQIATVVFLFIFSGVVKSANLDLTTFAKFNISVPLDEGVSTEVEIVWPQSYPKAIVVVVPGTAGLSDQHFDAEIAKTTYIPDSRGGLTAKLIENNYAVAFYNHRGYVALDKCVSGHNFDERVVSFVARCVNPEIRKSVKLSTIEADTAAIFNALKEHAQTRNLPQIALAYSEGMIHVSSLIQKQKIKPLGIVAVGGPIESMSYVMEFQFGHKFYFDLIDKAFLNCRDDIFDVERLLTCSDSSAFPEFKNTFQTVIGGQTLSRNDLPVRREFFKKFVQNAFEKFENISPTEYVTGTFRQFVISKNWSAGYFTEAFSDKESTPHKLEKYSGKIVYLFGSLDHSVPIHPSGTCALAPENLNKNCTIKVIQGVGHTLEGRNNLPTEDALNQIASAIDAVNGVGAVNK